MNKLAVDASIFVVYQAIGGLVVYLFSTGCLALISFCAIVFTVEALCGLTLIGSHYASLAPDHYERIALEAKEASLITRRESSCDEEGLVIVDADAFESQRGDLILRNATSTPELSPTQVEELDQMPQPPFPDVISPRPAPPGTPGVQSPL